MSQVAQNTLRILLVDDIANIENDIARSLSNNGFSFTIDYVDPKDRDAELSGCEMPDAAALEAYDFALIDLELFFPTNTDRPDVRDMQGGTQILPYLRRNASWLPAIAQSRLLLKDVRHESLHLTGCFGFDGMIARDFFTNPKTNKLAWDELRSGAALRRTRSIVGETYSPADDAPVHIANIPDEEARADPEMRALLQTVGVLFHGASSATLDPLTPGFSGARVFRALVTDSEQPNHDSLWLVKASSHPSRLSSEVEAHVKMMRAGHEFAISVPLLWRGVVVTGHLGAVAYGFATETIPASRGFSLSDTVSLRRVEEVIRSFHGTPSRWLQTRLTPREAVAEFGPSENKMNTAVAELSSRSRKFYSRLKDEATGILAVTGQYRSTRIHGDLHLDNVLVGQRSVLIDFARSRVGPVVADLARLHADLYRVLFSGSKLPLSLWDDTDSLFWMAWPAFKLPGEFTADDRRLFDILTWVHVVAFLAYEDTSRDFRLWLQKAIPKLTTKLERQLEA